MSGPKGYQWSVRQAELERLSAVVNARAQCRQLFTDATAVAAATEALGAHRPAVLAPPEIADDTTVEEARRTVAAYELSLRAVHNARSVARRAVVERALNDGVAPPTGASVRMPRLAGAGNTRRVQQHRPEETSARHADVGEDVTAAIHVWRDRLVGALSEVRNDRMRTEWTAEAVRVAKRTDIAARDRLAQLTLSAEAALRDQSQDDALRAEARQIASSIAHVTSPAGDAARAALDVARTRSDLVAAAQLATAAGDEWTAALARRYVIDETIAALRDMGHVVDTEFAVAAHAGRFAVATEGSDGRYGLKMRFLPGTATLLTNSVALAEATTRGEDIAAEELACTELDRLGERLRALEIDVTKTHERRPGEVPMERQLGTPARSSTRSAQRTTSRAARTQGHG